MVTSRKDAKEIVPPTILIDTCVWLDLAKDYRQRSLLQAIEALVKREKIQLAVPKPIVEELARNKDRIIRESSQSLSAALKRARETVDKFGDRRRKRSAINELDEVDRKVLNLSDTAAEMVGRVEKLIEMSGLIEISDSIKVRAANRGLEKKAPFHRHRNSMGDAIIFECYCDIVARSKSGQRTAFVTHNTNDFSHPTEDNRLPHPDLAQFFSPLKSRYFITLGEALRAMGSEEFADIMIEEEWTDVPLRRLKELLAAEDELTTKVWYNRHMVRREAIEVGRIRLVDKDTTYEPGAIKKNIWDGALKAATSVEKRLGLESLGPWSDFEWGMINGKLSAIRWVLGYEWDMLDT